MGEALAHFDVRPGRSGSHRKQPRGLASSAPCFRDLVVSNSVTTAILSPVNPHEKHLNRILVQQNMLYSYTIGMRATKTCMCSSCHHSMVRHGLLCCMAQSDGLFPSSWTGMQVFDRGPQTSSLGVSLRYRSSGVQLPMSSILKLFAAFFAASLL